MAAFIEERKMSRKKSNRLSLEQHKRTYRENQAAIAKALEQNAELEKAIIEEENLEIVGNESILHHHLNLFYLLIIYLIS